jgi:transcriptional regulator with XRE-family HTH domain
MKSGGRKSARSLQKRANVYDLQVGERLALLRRARGLSQGELGQQLGITFQQVQKYERGTNRVSAGRLYEIAVLLGVKIDYFFQQTSPGSHPAATPASSGSEDDLLTQFEKIKDEKVRARVLQLIGALASGTK